MDAETQEIRQARQRASVKWLLSKAFNNRVPDNLKEPFYRDHENQERLKPQIIVEMGNATLYCQTLSNLYSDPNYQSLNHWSILQTLARKGVPVVESPDMPLTETVLIQTNPLRINAHISVIESLMILYAKEISSGDRIPNAIRRISGSYQSTVPTASITTTTATGSHKPMVFEQSLLAWISHACAALKKRIAKDVETGITDEHGVLLQTPDIPPVRDIQDLCDGICLALLIAYYCPKVVPWSTVRINYLPAVEDSIYNVLLVSSFSQKHLPYSVFHMTPEDITYMRGSMKLNLIVLIADLFNLFEIHPAKCVCYPGMDALVLRSASNILAHNSNRPLDYQQQAVEANHNEAFVVHKSRGITTLSSMHTQHHLHQQQQQQSPHQTQQQQEPLVPARLRQAKEKTNTETKADERGDFVPAGRPSNWEQNRRPSYAGRRSRRNSSSEDSQLTIENFGGSQDQLNTVGRYERERERDRERKLSNASIEPAVAVRSSIADARGTLQLGYDTDSGSEKQDRETEKYLIRRQGSVDNVSLMSANTVANANGSPVTGMAAQQQQQQQHQKQQHSIDKDCGDDPRSDYDATLTRKLSQSGMHQKTAAIQQWQNNQGGSSGDPYEDNMRTMENASKLSTIRMKLEEKQRRLEQDKRKIELAMMRHQDKDDIESCADMMKWETMSNESKRTPDIDPVDLDKYQQSIAIMNMNLQDIQQDIQRLATQQSQMQAQQMQAQQLVQAQQIANMLNQQQSYGSQQHLADNYQQRTMHQQSFGSTPHLPQSFNSPMNNVYSSRPPSRDPYQQQHPQQQMPPLPMQYVNEHGQYMSPQQQQAPPPHYMQPQSMYSEIPYNNHGGYGGGGAPQYASQSHQPQQPHPHQAPYMGRNSVYDDYAPQSHLPHHGGIEPNSPQQQNHFYLHEMSPQPAQPPQPMQRRTWSHSAYEQQKLQQQQQQQQQQMPMVDVNAWQSAKKSSLGGGDGGTNFNWGKQHTAAAGTSSQQQQQNQQQQGFVLHQNGGGGEFQHLFQVHSSPQHAPRNAGGCGGVGVERQQSMTNLRDNRSPLATAKASTAEPQPKILAQPPPDDMMAPQSICFIGDEEDVDEIERTIIESMQATRLGDYPLQQHQHQLHLQQQHGERGSSSDDYDSTEMLSNKLNITSGNLTYRIPSPSRPTLHANSFQDPRGGKTPEKGFYISFDDEQPKRPKPPLRAKRSSPKKEPTFDGVDHQIVGGCLMKRESLSQLHNNGAGAATNYNGSATDEKNLQQHHHYNNNNNKVNSNNIQNNSDNAKNSNGNGRSANNKATYNKYTDVSPTELLQMAAAGVETAVDNNHDHRRHLEDLTNQQQHQQLHPHSPTNQFSSAASRQQNNNQHSEAKKKAIIIGIDVATLDPDSVDEMERRKEKMMLNSLQRRQRQEEVKARKEIEASQKREREREKEEERARKKEEQMARRAAILEQHRLKKAIEEAEREGKTLDRTEFNLTKTPSQSNASAPRLRPQRVTRPRPKTIHVDDGSVDISEASSISSRSKKGSSTNLTESPDEYPSTSSTPIGRRGSYKTSREPNIERGRTLSRISVAKGSSLNFRGRKSNSLMNLCDSGLGRATPPRRAPSPGMAAPSGRHMTSPSGPGSLPPGLISKRRGFDDGSSDISSNQNSMLEYSGPKLYKQPAAKSNRGIILNAVEYCVFPGAVNRDAKQKVLEKIARSEAKHFLVLFRDAGCQFRALYSYAPETDQVCKLYGTGPSQVIEEMFDKFFKYNSGGKCFSQVHTKHLTVTIDAFTIHNALWQGKKVQLPSKKDMALVI